MAAALGMSELWTLIFVTLKYVDDILEKKRMMQHVISQTTHTNLLKCTILHDKQVYAKMDSML